MRIIGGYNSLDAYAGGDEYDGALVELSGWVGPNVGRATSPTIVTRNGYFDSGFINSVCPVRVGDELFVYYTGWDGTVRRIGYFIADPATFEVLSRPTSPLLPLGGSGTWDSYQHLRSVVFANPSPSHPISESYVMVFGGTDTSDLGYGIGLAFSEDGLTWIKHTGNPIKSKGSYAAVVESCNILYDNGVYHLYVGCYGASPTYWAQTLHLTATDIKGTWTTAGDLAIARRSGCAQQLSAGATVGSTAIHVSTPASFDDGHPIVLNDVTKSEFVKVVSKDATYLYLDRALTNSFSAGAWASGFQGGKMVPSMVRRNGDEFHLYVTEYGWAPNAGAVMNETTSIYRSNSLDGPWTGAWDLCPVLSFDPRNARFDRTSQENLFAIDWDDVSNLTADSVGSAVRLTWTDNITNEIGWRVEKRKIL